MRLAPPDASRFSVRVFGSFEVRVNGFALPRFGRKAEGLLALLVLNHDRVVTRRTYADILYPDTASDAGRYVSKLVLELRKALGEEDWRLGERYARELRFDLRDAWIDLLAFDQAMA